jgi:hypothetical protein
MGFWRINRMEGEGERGGLGNEGGTLNIEGLRLAEKWRVEKRGTTNVTKDTKGSLGGASGEWW